MDGEISLLTLGGGIAIEKFDEELQKVSENILDPNTEATAKREIVLRIAIKPGKDRTWGAISVSSQVRLSPAVCFETRGFFGVDKDGNAHAFEDNPKQVTIGDFLKEQSEKVTQLQSQQKAVQGK